MNSVPFEDLTDYDDSPWTEEERDALAVEMEAMLDDDMAIEDPEEPQGPGN
jgi:hypothetical protein